MRYNLSELPLAERMKIDIDKRSAFAMWSMVLEQPRAKGKPPMTRQEINAELQGTGGDLYEYHLGRLRHWRDHYEEIRSV